MTNEEKRIKIAKACGWNDPHWECPNCGRVEPSQVTFEEHHDKDGCLSFVYWVDCPDYFSDLNACHEMEKALVGRQVDSYVTTLCLEIQPSPSLWNATASQRAEAFGKTMNLW